MSLGDKSILPGILSTLPVIGSIGAAALSRRWAQKDLQQQNLYNSPKQQIERLKEAGLPLASMFSGSGGSQSEQPRQTQIDPSLGAAKGLEQYYIGTMQKKQLQLITEQIGKAEADKTISQVAANEALGVDKYRRGPVYDKDGFLQIGNRQTQDLDLTMRQKEAQTKTTEVIADLQQARTQAEIDHILNTIKLGNQTFDINSVNQKTLNELIKNIGDGKWDLVQSMLYRLIFK